MRLAALIFAAGALVSATAPGRAEWKVVESSKGYRMERIEFQKGTAPGQLNYQRNPVQDDLPSILSVGPSGEIYVLEPSLNRIQAFGPSGKFLSMLTPADVPGGAEFVNVFAVSPYRAKVLMSLKPQDGVRRYAWFTFQSDRKSVSDYVAPLSQPPIEGAVATSFLDREGFLWLQGAQWIVVAPDGKAIVSRVAQDGTYVDGNGLLYVPGNGVRLFDKHGRPLASVRFEPDNAVEIRGGDLGTLLYGLESSPLERKGNLRERTNVLVLMRFDRNAQLLRLGRIQLPPTVLAYPTPNPDVMVPVQRYLPDLSTLRGAQFYIMAHSHDKFWIDRVDLSSQMPR